MSSYSLKHRLGRSLLINLLMIMALLLFGLNYMILELVRDHAATRLQHDGDSLISELHRDDKGLWAINPAHLSTIYSRVRSGHYYRVETPSAVMRSRSLFDFEFEPRELVDGASSVYRMPGAGEEEWLVWQRRVNKDGDDIEIWVAEDLSPVYRGMRHFSIYALVLVALSTMIALYRQQRILSASFRVFERLRDGLSQHEQGDQPFDGDSIPREVSPLIAEIDQLVRDLRQRTQRSRNAIANLAHALKRPLQILTLRHASAERDADSARAIADIQAVIDRELRRARLSGSDRVGGQCDLLSELPHLLDMTARIYPQIRVRVNAPKALPVLPYDRGDVLELVGNLLDNACKFARSRVDIHVFSETGRFFLGVDDDGSGVADSAFADLAKAGFRVDESVQGHGLGLGLCADIVSGFQGDMTFARSDLGGLRVEVSLPWRSRAMDQ